MSGVMVVTGGSRGLGAAIAELATALQWTIEHMTIRNWNDDKFSEVLNVLERWQIKK